MLSPFGSTNNEGEASKSARTRSRHFDLNLIVPYLVLFDLLQSYFEMNEAFFSQTLFP